MTNLDRLVMGLVGVLLAYFVPWPYTVATAIYACARIYQTRAISQP